MENMTPLAAHFDGAGGAIILALIAFSVVFLVLAALSLIIMANRVIAEKVESFKKSTAPAPKKAAPPKGAAPQKAVATPAAPAQCVASGEDEHEIVAVITAAIAATLGSGAAILDIRPAVSMRKHGRVGPLWRSYAKTSAMEGLE